MIADGLWQPKSRKRARIHPRRPRRPCRGELVQIDGSPHDWFEGRGPRCTLIVFIDDATGELMALPLCPDRDHLGLHADPAGVSESAWASRCPVFRQAQHLPDQSPRARRGVDPVLPRHSKPLISRPSTPTPRRPRGGWNEPIRPYRIAWSRKCVCGQSPTSIPPIPSCQPL